MSDWTVATAVRGSNFHLTLGAALHTWKIQGLLRRLLIEAAVEKLLGDTLRIAGVEIQDDELQAAANRFRAIRHLHTVEQTNRWLRQQGWSRDDLESAVLRDVQFEKFLGCVPRGAIERAFERRHSEYDRVRLRRIVVASEGVAHELLARLREENADFGDLAQRFSLDANSRNSGGDLGLVERRALPASLAARIFSAGVGAFVGPVLTDSGVAIYRVEEFATARLNDAVERSLRLRLCRLWLAREVRAQKLTYPLLDDLAESAT